MKFLREIKAWYLAIKKLRAIYHYGPDLPTIISRELSIEDVEKETSIKWGQEAYYLLPRRYKLILNQLFVGNVITKEMLDRYINLSQITILGIKSIYEYKDGEKNTIEYVEFPWVENPNLFSVIPQSLKERISSFKEDCKNLQKSKSGISLLKIKT